MKLKESVSVIRKKGIYYILNENGKIKKYKPWLGDLFAFLYDRIMEKSVFPGKFCGSITKHYNILKDEYQSLHGVNLLEIAAGSGFSAGLMPNDISYTGIDISSGLLSIAVRKFKSADFSDAEFYIASASDLPFSNDIFNVVICDLSLNFLGDIEIFISELRRVMKKNSVFYCSVPVPERKPSGSVIHGNLYSEKELKTHFEKNNFTFIPKPFENGALLYFAAKLESKE